MNFSCIFCSLVLVLPPLNDDKGLVNIFHTWLHFNLNSPSKRMCCALLARYMTNDDMVTASHQPAMALWFIIHGVVKIELFGTEITLAKLPFGYMGKCYYDEDEERDETNYLFNNLQFVADEMMLFCLLSDLPSRVFHLYHFSDDDW